MRQKLKKKEGRLEKVNGEIKQLGRQQKEKKASVVRSLKQLEEKSARNKEDRLRLEKDQH